MKKLILVLLIALAGFTAQAQDKKSKNAKFDVGVKGNCGQCKARIEKAAFGVKGVKSATWHDDDQMLHLIIDENKCTTADVSAAVAKSGHDTDKVKATVTDYNALHSCCQYNRE